ncbi:hypothetical protein FKM82_005253 [Ascaphus truei]
MFSKKMMLLLWPSNYHISRMFSIESKKVLDQQVALVIGSTYGIGLAIARRLAQDGATVLLNSRKQENVDRAVRELTEEGLNVSGTICHVGKAEDREKLVETALQRYGKINILVCNAAVNPNVGPLLETTEEIWNKVLGVNVTSHFLMTKLVVPHMQKEGIGEPEECGGIASFLCSPDASYINGENITVSGGSHGRL